MMNKILIYFTLIILTFNSFNLFAQGDGPGDDLMERLDKQRKRKDRKWNEIYAPLKNKLDKISGNLQMKQDEIISLEDQISESKKIGQVLEQKYDSIRAESMLLWKNEKMEKAKVYAKSFCDCRDLKMDEQIKFDKLLKKFSKQLINRIDFLSKMEELFNSEIGYYNCVGNQTKEYSLYELVNLTYKYEGLILKEIKANCEESLVLIENDVNLMLRFFQVVWPEFNSQLRQFDLELKFQ